ncbi:MAG: hypothetical protein AAF992_04410 [Bacteroidota bacterium]
MLRFKNFKWLLFLPLLFLLMHGFVEGIRWQLVLAYGIAVLSALILFTPASIRFPRYINIILISIAAVLVVISLLLGYLLPVFRLPEPSGSFTVGTTYLHLRDDTRSETITSDSSDVRELMVRAWYPSEEKTQETYPYLHPALTKVLAENYGLPKFILSHLDLVKTHSLPNASIASHETPFPMIIFSPGYMTHSSMYTSLLETLASHGYMVFSIDYTYETPVSIFPDNDLRFYDPDYTDVWKNASWDTVQASINAFRDANDKATKRRHIEQYLTQVPFTDRVNQWTKDVNFVIDQLHSEGHPFFYKIDQNNIGVMGNSVGGATSALACALDSRIKSGINLDGSQWGSLMEHTITQPFMWITAEKNLAESSEDIDSFIYNQVSRGDFDHLSIAHATHANFYDLSLWSNYAPLTQTGSIDGHRMIKIVNQCTLNFFNKHLKNEPIVIDHLTKEFNELVRKDR